MADVFSARKRSEIMRSIKSRNTRPELEVRSSIHKLGYRFRIHQKVLPGDPDIVLKRHKKVVFVHGCFWHGHESCRRAVLPKANKSFWKKKIESNWNRDKKQLRDLRQLGWKSLVIWTCELSDKNRLERRLKKYLSKDPRGG